MKKIIIKDNYIKLGQLLKLAGFVSMGSEAKEKIEQGQVKVNGIVVKERGKKIKPGDNVMFHGEEIEVEN